MEGLFSASDPASSASLDVSPAVTFGCDRASTVLQSTNRGKHSSSTLCSCELLDGLKLFKQLHCSLRFSWSFEQSKQFKIL